MMRILLGLMIGVSLICCCGCGGGPKLYPVTGMVTMDGEPFAECTIMFTPTEDAGASAVAVTSNDGSFEVQTTSGAKIGFGMLAGNYSVTFSKVEQKWDGKSYYPDSVTLEPVKDIRAHQTLPVAYTSSAATPPFNENVGSNKNHFTFDLKRKP